MDHAVPTSSHRRSDIQGLRAFAVVAVVLNHAFPELVPGGYIGVDVFFVISGFVITGLIRREVRRGEGFRFARFYVRRVYRLMPALGVCVLITCLLSALLVSPIGMQAQSGLTGLMADLWASNFSLWFFASDYFSPQVQLNPFLHTWSLGVEEQFYILFPALLVAAGALGRRAGRPVVFTAVAVAAVSVASLALSAGMTYGHIEWVRGSETFAFYSVVTRIWEFGGGSVLALAMEGRTARRGSVAGSVAAFAGSFVLVASLFLFDEATPFPGYLAVVPVLATALVIAAGPSGIVSRALATPAPVRVGDVSYSLYLWHWPVIVLGKRVVGDTPPALAVMVAVSYVAAELSYRYVEERWRHRAGGGQMRRLVPVIPFLVLPAIAAVALGIGGQTSWGNQNLHENSQQLVQRPAQNNICGGYSGLISLRDMSACTWGAERSGRPIYLLGDSNAQQFTEALISAGADLGRPVIVASRGGCPLIETSHRVVGTVGTTAIQCRAWVRDAKRWLEGQEPGTVIMGAAGEAVTDDSIELRGRDGVWTSDRDSKAKIWRESSISGARSVSATGHDVVVIAPVPHLPGQDRPWWHPVECANIHWFMGEAERCSRDVTRGEYIKEQGIDRESAEASARAVDGNFLDLTEELCPADRCGAYRDGRWWYRDGLHLSTHGSEQLAGAFVRVLESP